MGKKPAVFSLPKAPGSRGVLAKSRAAAKARAPHKTLAATEMVLSALLN